MFERLDRRVVPEPVVDLLREIATSQAFHLAGGVALAGAHLGHRRSGDVDLFVHDAVAFERLCDAVRAAVSRAGGTFDVVQSTPHFVRGNADLPSGALSIDIVHERVPDLRAPSPPIDGVTVESLQDLRASKWTCLLSRSEPRDLVDVMFLERAGHRMEDDFALALQKDAGMDPATLAWLLTEFPVEPLPQMLVAVTVAEVREYRDALADRFRRMAVPER